MNPESLQMIREWRNNPEIVKWMFTSGVITLDEHYQFINKLKNDKNNTYWLVKDNAKELGVINLNEINFFHKNAYIGIYLYMNHTVLYIESLRFLNSLLQVLRAPGCDVG